MAVIDLMTIVVAAAGAVVGIAAVAAAVDGAGAVSSLGSLVVNLH